MFNDDSLAFRLTQKAIDEAIMSVQDILDVASESGDLNDASKLLKSSSPETDDDADDELSEQLNDKDDEASRTTNIFTLFPSDADAQRGIDDRSSQTTAEKTSPVSKYAEQKARYFQYRHKHSQANCNCGGRGGTLQEIRVAYNCHGGGGNWQPAQSTERREEGDGTSGDSAQKGGAEAAEA